MALAISILAVSVIAAALIVGAALERLSEAVERVRLPGDNVIPFRHPSGESAS